MAKADPFNDHELLKEYRKRMDLPMENLANEVLPIDGRADGAASDDEIVELAFKKIQMLRRMLVAAGVSKAMVDAVMAEGA